MLNVNEVIRDNVTLAQGYVDREGYIFTALTGPANVYNAIVLRQPSDALCFSPRVGISKHSLEEHIGFVNTYKLQDAIIIANNIEFIKRCPSLTRIRIIPADNAGNGFDFSPLYELRQIDWLKCDTEYGKDFKYSSSVDYSKIQGVKHLSVEGVGNLNFNKGQTLKSLQLLRVKGQNGDLTDLFTSERMEKLDIGQSNVQFLHGLGQSNCLQSLSLFNNRRLKNIDDLGLVNESLLELSIDSCNKIEDFSVLYTLKNLRHLCLLGNNNLPDLNFLINMKQLRVFRFSMNVCNGDLTPCLRIPYVSSDKNRRHYNLRDNDLPKNIVR